MLVSMMIFVFIILFYSQHKYRIVINIINGIYTSSIVVYSFGNKISSFMILALWMILMIFMARNIFLIITNMDLSRKDNNKFKYIFDKLDESIIIIQDKSLQIDYVNNKFLMEFKHEIFTIYN